MIEYLSAFLNAYLTENFQEIPEEETAELQSNQVATAEFLQEKETAIESFPWKILAFGLEFIWGATMLM